jgi:hypothetical protein
MDNPYATHWCGYCAMEISGDEVIEEIATERLIHNDCGRAVVVIEPPGGSEYVPV